MKIVGCDFHPSHQQVAVFDTTTGEVEEVKLIHGDGQAERFYRQLESPALIGMESVGNSRWLDRGCGADSGQLCAPAKDRQAGCGPHSEAVVGKAVSAYLDAVGRAAGPAA